MINENFSINMNWSMGQQDSGDPTRYIALPFQAHSIHDGQVLLMVAGSTETRRLPVQLAHLLSCCTGLRTIAEHARHAAGAMRLPHQQVAGLKQPLQQLIDAKLLTSERDLFENLAAGDDANDDEHPIETLFIRTCARPETLRRLLESLARQPEGGLKRCVIIDDSKEASDRQATREAVEAARSMFGIGLHLVDHARRRALLKTIAHAVGCESASLEWFLEGEADEKALTYGAGPNLSLLLGAGSRFALMDDDATLDAFVPEGSRNRPIFSPEPDDRLWLPDPDAEVPGSDLGQLDENPLSAHARYLGRRPGDLLDADDPDRSETLGQLTPDLLHQLTKQPRIRLTCSGVLGDPGTEDVQWIYGMPAEDLRVLCSSEDAYRRRVFQRRVLRCPQRAVATPAYGLMTTTLTGVDNRELLLPTAARERNEDMLLGALIAFLYPRALHLTLPHALYHMRPKPQEWSADDLDRVRRPGRARYLCAWLEDLAPQCHTRDPQARTDMLIAALRDLAQQDRDSLKAAVERLQTELRSNLVQRIQRSCDELKPPDWLRADFRRVMEACATIPADEPDRLDRIAASTQRFAANYADKLPDWCRAWRHCSDTGIERLLETAGE
ncbi:glycosyltransferase family protein [Wenzhouxiangella sp. EGI_FJ10305]|uniref:hypothetical protein n=1 Tax=Wenzhouxiangella sp. EGI_FJ10305 TaxID=3243768 RepID=UPI0035DA4B72